AVETKGHLLVQLQLRSLAEPREQFVVNSQGLLIASYLSERPALVTKRPRDLFAYGQLSCVTESLYQVVVDGDRIADPARFAESKTVVEKGPRDLCVAFVRSHARN